ncbi:CehA/McbA family metallohydrolase [Roseiconus lacunae]|uniref:CehA/McbA family metallohydrolase n=1 Tax=Roseiconus lacunae TaxID=2605694 RepID=UPI001E3F43B2|nr:CehA/McbA family metallohydrolase [Roseiconus lacunae]
MIFPCDNPGDSMTAFLSPVEADPSNRTTQRLSRPIGTLRRFGAVLLTLVLLAPAAVAHEGHLAKNHSGDATHERRADEQSEQAFQLFSFLLSHWPSDLHDALIRQAWEERQWLRQSPDALTEQSLRDKRERVVRQLHATLPAIKLRWDGRSLAPLDPSTKLLFCRTIPSPLLVTIINDDHRELRLRIKNATDSAIEATSAEQFNVSSHTASSVCLTLRYDAEAVTDTLPLPMVASSGQRLRDVTVPIELTDPATIHASVTLNGQPTASRVLVRCSDGVYRHGGSLASKSTLTEKLVVYPPIDVWKKVRHFYVDGDVSMTVPPGLTTVTAEQGFEVERQRVVIDAQSRRTGRLQLQCQPIKDLPQTDWVSGDTHVHWVTNQWNVDEPLELLSVVQRAEGVQVVNNLTLLQRQANHAFIKPSQAPMGPIDAISDSIYHVQMGEEYRNEDLYGHLCFLNLDWLVQPIGTGAIIAGPDALDYPLNRTAIESCRQQGGISIEAHGTGGNKDVPVNVIHRLTDSLDQMEPSEYYRLLDCGFRLPLSNGSDHPARTLGAARTFVNVEPPLSYSRWIEGIREGRTFTTSGPMIYLSVNDGKIGDVFDTGPQEPLKIVAKFVSRDRIGVAQIVSNGTVVAEKRIDANRGELKLTIPAEHSRWIVARCSNRNDGRSDFGFGNFNAILGPGIGHTSPIYVTIDGQPRFDPAAAAYWRSRIREHIRDIQTKGRFATDAQLHEAITYMEDGIAMYEQLELQRKSARSLVEPWQTMRDRLINVIRRFGDPARTVQTIQQLHQATGPRTTKKALEELTLLKVSVNPESRVKIASTRDRIELRQDRPQRFLIEVENIAGVTAPLNITGFDLSFASPLPADWCSIRVIDSPFTSIYLTGNPNEYKVVELTAHKAGLREIRLVGDAGQGTQDLGFRATTDLLLDVKPRRWGSAP